MAKKSNALAVYNGGNGNGTSDSWEQAASRRGQRYRGHAVAFLAAFPIGTTLTQDEFAAWAEQRQLIETPPATLPKFSFDWQGFVTERNQLRYRLNEASAHPALLNAEAGTTPFVIDSVANNRLQVRACEVAIAKFEMARPVAGLMKAKQRKLGYLMQSADWTKLPPHMLTMGRMLWTDASAFEQDVDTGAGRLLAKFKNFENMLQQVTVAQIGGND